MFIEDCSHLQPTVSHFCLNATSGFATCEETTGAQIIAYAEGLARCFKTAVDAGLDIAVDPHLIGEKGILDLGTQCLYMRVALQSHVIKSTHLSIL